MSRMCKREGKMAAPRAGIRRFLKDPSASWNDRLKVARYAWVMPSCYIPNKYQVLLDWVCQALSSFERCKIPEDDFAGLWMLLKEMLQSKEFTSMGGSLTIPNSFYNQLCQSLPQKSVYQDDVITVTQEILSQPKLCEMLLSKVDVYINFLSCLLSMLRDVMKAGDYTDSVLVPLTDNALQHFNDKFKFRLVHKKVFDDIVQKLLISCLCVHQQITVPHIRLSVESLLSETLFSKDMLPLYLDFFKHLTEESATNHKLPQSLPKAMNLLQEKLNSDTKTDEFEAVMAGIPLLYKLFLTSLRPKTDVSFAMFKRLVNLIGFSATKDSWEGSPCQRSCVMDCLYQLLLLMSKHNIYSVSDDEASGGKQRIYLGHLISQVVELHQWEQTSWFRSLYLIFQLNHKLLEEHQSVILTAALSQVEVKGQSSDHSGELEDAQLALLCEVSDTYLKLRQFNKFCVYLLKSCTHSEGEKIQLPPKFLTRFGANVQDLPQRTSFGIWSSMNTALTQLTLDLSNKLKQSISEPPSKKMKKLNGDFCQRNALQNVAILLGTFLRNCKVVEYSAVPQGAETLKKLLQQLVTDIITPSIATLEQLQYDHGIKDDLVTLLFSTLFLVCCHGDVKLLLHNYVKGEGLRSEGLDTPLNGRTFHYLHAYLEEDTWQRIISLCAEVKNIRIQFILEKLQMQQIRMLVLTGENENKAVQESLQNLTSELCTLVHVSKFNSQSPQYNGALSVSTINYHSAHLQLLVQHYPILSPYMSEVSRLNFVSLLCQSLFSVQPSEKYEGVCTLEIAETFLKSDMCKESKDLHGLLVTKSLEDLSSLLKIGHSKSCESHSSKKKRRSYVEAMSLMKILEHPTELHHNLKLMASEGIDPENQSVEELCQTIAQFLKILTVLPIGLLSADQQTDCVMALLVLDFGLNQRTISDTQVKPWQLLADIRRLEAEFVKEMQRTDKVCQVNLKKVILELTTSHLKLCGKVLSNHCHSNTEDLYTINEHTCELLFHWLRREKVWSNDSGCVKGLMKKMITSMEETRTSDDENLCTSAALIDISTVLLRFCCKHCDQMPSNFFDFTSEIHHLIDKVTRQNEFLKGATDLHFASLSVTKFFLALHEMHQDGEVVAMDTNLATLQNKTRSGWLKMLLSRFLLLSPLDHSDTLIKLNHKMTSLTLRLVQTRIKQGKVSDKVCRGLCHLLGQSVGELPSDLQETFKMAMIHMTDTQMQQCVTDSISSLNMDIKSLRVGLKLWLVIPFSELSPSKFELIFNVASQFVSYSPFLLQQLVQSDPMEGDLVSLLLNSVAAVISQGKNLLTEETAMTSLSLCSLLPLDLILPSHFPSVFQAVCRLVTNLIGSFHQSVLKSSHCYVTCLQHLLKSVMQRGQQTRNEGIPDEKLFMCAENMERLLTLFSSHKDTKQVTGFLVATFIQELQKGTLLPSFKKTLVLGVYNIVASCDFKTQSLIQKTMPGELREVYKSFVQDYYKYHQYKGRI